MKSQNIFIIILLGLFMVHCAYSSSNNKLTPVHSHTQKEILVPINVPTNIGYVSQKYQQVGILTPKNKKTILPLMGRQIFTSRDKWQYYTMSDQFNSIQLPIIKNHRNCTNEYGCDMLSSNDVVFVEGYDEAFKVTIYGDSSLSYLPLVL
jgi:hypothetical protein